MRRSSEAPSLLLGLTIGVLSAVFVWAEEPLVIDPPAEPVEHVEVGAVEISDKEEARILNPGATLPIIFALNTEEVEDGWRLDGYYIPNNRIVVFPENGELFAYSVLIHEVFHHVAQKAADRDWTLNERIKLSWLLYQVLEDIVDLESGFETHTHEKPPHWFIGLEGDDLPEAEDQRVEIDEPRHVLDIWRAWATENGRPLNEIHGSDGKIQVCPHCAGCGEQNGF